MRFLVAIASLLAFLPIVQLIGWNWASESAPGWMKIHPTTYILCATAAGSLILGNRKAWNTLLSHQFFPFVCVTTIILTYSILISRLDDQAAGILGLALTSFVTPVLLLMSLSILTQIDRKIFATVLRVLIVANSSLAIGERLLHKSLFYAQEGHIFRSGGILAHPIPSSAVAGMAIVYLLTSGNARVRPFLLLPELALHVAAMFAFGSRTGLILVPVVVAVGMIVPSGSDRKDAIIRQVLIVVIAVIGFSVLQLRLDLFTNVLDRFQNDSGSANTRLAAFQILSDLKPNELLFGASQMRRTGLMERYGTDIAIEISWVALTVSYGLVLVIPLAITFCQAVLSMAARLDRSAWFLALYMLISSASSVGFGSKSMAISQFIVILYSLCQKRSSMLRLTFQNASKRSARVQTRDEPQRGRHELITNRS